MMMMMVMVMLMVCVCFVCGCLLSLSRSFVRSFVRFVTVVYVYVFLSVDGAKVARKDLEIV